MTTTQTPDQTTPAAVPPPDLDALMEFVGRFVGDLGATMAAGNVLVGERLGLYRALAGRPSDARALAERTGTDPRYVEEWLRGQAAGGYVEYDAASATYSMTPEQAFALTDPTGPVFLPGAFELALGALKAEPRIEQAFRTGGGRRLARARPGRVHRLRAVLPPRLPDAPARRVDPGAGRRGGASCEQGARSPTWAAATAPRRC